MNRDSQLIQRLVDGLLAPHEADAVERSLTDRGALADLQAARGLHQLLSMQAHPLSADEHHALMARMIEHLPRALPQSYAKFRPVDLVLACAAICLISVSFGAVGSFMHGSVVLVTIACISVVSGCALVVLAGMLRRAEAGLMRHVLRRPVTVGPSDLLVYRAVGIGMALGGMYLAHAS